MEVLEDLYLEGTKTSPSVMFNKNGMLKIEGRAMPDNAIRSFEPLAEWISELNCNSVVFDIVLEYLNTAASMQLFSLIRTLEQNCSIQELVVHWHYEEDDEDHFETGHLFEEKLNRTKFKYLCFE